MQVNTFEYATDPIRLAIRVALAALQYEAIPTTAHPFAKTDPDACGYHDPLAELRILITENEDGVLERLQWLADGRGATIHPAAVEPCTIIPTRYEDGEIGTYWLAFPLTPDQIPVTAYSDDWSHHEWFMAVTKARAPFGMGPTAHEAHESLRRLVSNRSGNLDPASLSPVIASGAAAPNV